MEEVFRKMLERWPSAILYRGESRNFTGGCVSPKSLANLDSRGEGPRGAFKIGAKTVYPAEEFVSWLENRSRPMHDDDRPSPRERARRRGRE